MEPVKKKVNKKTSDFSAKQPANSKLVVAKSMQQRGRESLAQKFLFVLLGIVIFRLGSCIPIPGVDVDVIRENMGSTSSFFRLVNLCSGGALEKISIFSLGLSPYILASMFLQVLSSALPSLKELRSEGGLGRQKINQYTRYASFFIALLQCIYIIREIVHRLSSNPSIQGIILPTSKFCILAVFSLVTGLFVLMWLSELMTEHGIGQGSSIIIFSGIVSNLPSGMANLLERLRQGQLTHVGLLLTLCVLGALTLLVAVVERTQRQIPVHYAQKHDWHHTTNVPSTVLPLKVNIAGILPIIATHTFSEMFRGGIGFLTSSLHYDWLIKFGEIFVPGALPYALFEAMVLALFSFSVADMQLDIWETASRLKKSAAFITGVRPGFYTAKFLEGIRNRLCILGSVYLILVSCLPPLLGQISQRFLGYSPFIFDGTSLLIVVGVIIEFVEQVHTHLVSHQYESLIKKSHFKTLKV